MCECAANSSKKRSSFGNKAWNQRSIRIFLRQGHPAERDSIRQSTREAWLPGGSKSEMHRSVCGSGRPETCRYSTSISIAAPTNGNLLPQVMLLSYEDRFDASFSSDHSKRGIHHAWLGSHLSHRSSDCWRARLRWCGDCFSGNREDHLFHRDRLVPDFRGFRIHAWTLGPDAVAKTHQGCIKAVVRESWTLGTGIDPRLHEITQLLLGSGRGLASG